MVTKEASIVAVYMIQVTYTAEAWATMTENPQDRSIPVSALLKELGGRLIDLYFCFGEYDVVALAEAPDDVFALATTMAAVTPGHLKSIKTTRLFTVEESLEAMRMAGRLTFQGPSRDKTT
jgi:uncharacterized protein with GYD domain